MYQNFLYNLNNDNNNNKIVSSGIDTLFNKQSIKFNDNIVAYSF